MSMSNSLESITNTTGGETEGMMPALSMMSMQMMQQSQMQQQQLQMFQQSMQQMMQMQTAAFERSNSQTVKLLKAIADKKKNRIRRGK